MENNKQRFNKLFELLSKEFVAPADLKRVMDVIVKAFQDFKKEVAENVASIKADFVAFKKRQEKQVAEVEARLADKVAKSERTTTKELQQARKQLSEAVNVFRERPTTPPELEQATTDIVALTERVASLSDLFVAENIRNMLELLTGDERLDKSAIKGLDDDFKQIRRGLSALQGASQTPGPTHWPRHQAFTMNGSDTFVTLADAPGAAGTALIVRYQGQTLDLTTHYTVDGNKITLVGFTPEADTIISVTYWP